ncbi:MAG: hypothetical protein MJE68_09395 [Proteobacteria bacterium]|nr:hypothetical protein [Pseudomonadota bacterium]
MRKIAQRGWEQASLLTEFAVICFAAVSRISQPFTFATLKKFVFFEGMGTVENHL